ncbi:tetratricopeptide repeat protein 12-like [Teleopsis dalmanni]|uniref:tetratricopeptide repeat protein 12-like n=1 Tax=Teleopsis dalmanni TaxID=139649 RepID=UPI0018CE4B26|nr:tetratricopeptide repeat protein 12-like [Teleopsis dalmanni]XP_037948053.1 tetratricopeptide repeat protein 12-like [Teleopsis dalmanni]
MNNQMNEDFLEFESKVNQVVKLLDDMSSIGKSDADAPVKTEILFPDDITEDNLIVQVKEDRTVINKKVFPLKPKPNLVPTQLDKFTFMQQIEQDADQRAAARQERERIAQTFRKLGNEAFRKPNYEKAITMYTQAIDHVKDSPILYNNRALAYIKLKNFKRAVIDCNFVLNKLEERNIRSWLYGAAAYKRLGDELNFENYVKFAKKHNSKQHEYIDGFVEKIKMGQF